MGITQRGDIQCCASFVKLTWILSLQLPNKIPCRRQTPEHKIFDNPDEVDVWMEVTGIAQSMKLCQVFPRHLCDDGLPDNQRARDAQPVGEERDGRGHGPLLRREPGGGEGGGGREVDHAGQSVQEGR